MCDEDSGSAGWGGVQCYIKSNEKFRLDSFNVGSIMGGGSLAGCQNGPTGRHFKLVTATELDREASAEEKIIIACQDSGMPIALTGLIF